MDLASLRSGMRLTTFVAATTLAALPSFSQTAPPPQQEPKRIFGIIPNHRSCRDSANYKPLTVKRKFKIGAQDSFDPGAIVLALTFAGVGQWRDANPSFGQGAGGFAKYFGAGYSDVILGNMMTEAIYPSMLRQDPRYFRRGTGSGWSRLGYAVSRIFVTQKDSGGREFNHSEVLGIFSAVAISNAYYPDGRDAAGNFSKVGIQMGLDAAGNILKEFAPDLQRKLLPRWPEKIGFLPNGPHPWVRRAALACRPVPCCAGRRP